MFAEFTESMTLGLLLRNCGIKRVQVWFVSQLLSPEVLMRINRSRYPIMLLFTVVRTCAWWNSGPAFERPRYLRRECLPTWHHCVRLSWRVVHGLHHVDLQRIVCLMSILRPRLAVAVINGYLGRLLPGPPPSQANPRVGDTCRDSNGSWSLIQRDEFLI